MQKLSSITSVDCHCRLSAFRRICRGKSETLEVRDSGEAGVAQTVKRSRSSVFCVIIFSLFTFYFLLFTTAFASDKWQGVDESVIEKYAKEHGREAREPLLNTGQGDLLLFAFLLAGSVGGFAAGYYWRTLTENRNQRPGSGNQTEEHR